MRTRLVDASTSDSLGVKSTQVTDVHNGTFTVTFDKDEVPSSGDLIILTGAEPSTTEELETTEAFAIGSVLNQNAYLRQAPLNIERP